MLAVTFWALGPRASWPNISTLMSHILSYTGYAVAPRKQRQDLATLWRGLQGEEGAHSWGPPALECGIL